MGDAIAFMAVQNTGKRDETVGREDVGGLARQVGVEPWICDSGASMHMAYPADGMVNYREVKRTYTRR